MNDENQGREAKEVGQNDQTATQQADVDYQALYNAEVGNSQKLRKRAQEAEGKISVFATKAEQDKEAKMIEDGNLKELVSNLKSENKNILSKLEKADAIVLKNREKLLNKVQESEREALQDLPFETLELVVSKMVPVNQAPLPSTTPGIKTPVSTKPYDQMNDQEKRDHHASIINA